MEQVKSDEHGALGGLYDEYQGADTAVSVARHAIYTGGDAEESLLKVADAVSTREKAMNAFIDGAVKELRTSGNVQATLQDISDIVRGDILVFDGDYYDVLGKIISKLSNGRDERELASEVSDSAVLDVRGGIVQRVSELLHIDPAKIRKHGSFLPCVKASNAAQRRERIIAHLLKAKD